MTIARLATSIAALAVFAASARAQSVDADVLFREGKRLLKAGKVAEACEKFEASDRVESSVGTLLNLGDCRERNHQLATAWGTFRRAARAAKLVRDAKREAEARRREKLLAPRLSYLTVEVPDASRVDGLSITRNGVELDRQLWNESVPVDADDYDLAASAPGHLGWETRMRIDAEAKRATVRVPTLEPQPTAAPPIVAPVVVSPPDTEDVERRHPRSPPSRLTGTRVVALGMTAIGVVGIGIGIGFGVHGKRLERDSDAICPTTVCNDTRALSLNTDARHAARNANIGYVAGGGMIVAAVVLWIVGSPRAVAPAIASDRIGLTFVGRL
jgi:serine/threonine-protein kinase